MGSFLDWLDGESKADEPDLASYGALHCQEGNVAWNAEYNAARNAPERDKEAGS